MSAIESYEANSLFQICIYLSLSVLSLSTFSLSLSVGMSVSASVSVSVSLSHPHTLAKSKTISNLTRSLARELRLFHLRLGRHYYWVHYWSCGCGVARRWALWFPLREWYRQFPAPSQRHLAFLYCCANLVSTCSMTRFILFYQFSIPVIPLPAFVVLSLRYWLA